MWNLIYQYFFYMSKLFFSDRIEDTFWTKTLDYTGFVSESRWNMKPLHQFIQRFDSTQSLEHGISNVNICQVCTALNYFWNLDKITNWFVDFRCKKPVFIQINFLQHIPNF